MGEVRGSIPRESIFFSPLFDALFIPFPCFLFSLLCLFLFLLYTPFSDRMYIFNIPKLSLVYTLNSK